MRPNRRPFPGVKPRPTFGTMHTEGRAGDALLLVLILTGLLLAMAGAASSLKGLTGPWRAMEPESWAESQCAGELGPSDPETAELDDCQQDALESPLWRLDVRS